MVSKAEVIDLMKSAKKHAVRCKKKKERYGKIYRVINVTLSILSSIQAAVSTYSVFSDTVYKKYIGMILSIAIATASAYVSLAEFPESIAACEVSASIYTHISSFLKKIYHNYDDRSYAENSIAVEYCQSTADFLECMIPDESSMGSTKSIELRHIETATLCDHTGYKYLETYKYTILEYSNNQFTHLYSTKNGTMMFCGRHGEVSNANSIFNGTIPRDNKLFKTSISDISTYEKKYIICECSGSKVLAVFVSRKAWESADMDVANKSIREFRNILDSDLFNSSISEAAIEVIIDKPDYAPPSKHFDKSSAN